MHKYENYPKTSTEKISDYWKWETVNCSTNGYEEMNIAIEKIYLNNR